MGCQRPRLAAALAALGEAEEVWGNAPWPSFAAVPAMVASGPPPT